MKIIEEINSLGRVLKEANKELKSFNYTLEIRQGEVKRTILSEVFNGTEFDE